MSADAQVLRPEPYGQRNDNRDPYYRDDPYYEDDRDARRERRRARREARRDDYGYGRQGAYGYGGDPLDAANRIMSDVRSVYANNRGIGSHDRKHFEEVEEELGKFSRKYREGKYDRNNLKDASESLQHLTRADSIRSSRDRRVLQEALSAVEDLRSGRYDVSTRSRADDRGSVWDVLGGR